MTQFHRDHASDSEEVCTAQNPEFRILGVGRELCHEDEYEYEDDHTKRSVMKVLMSAWFAE